MASFFLQQRANGRTAQQQQQQQQRRSHNHKHSPKTSTSSPRQQYSYNNKKPLISIRTVGYWFIGGMAVFFLSGLVFLTLLWQSDDVDATSTSISTGLSLSHPHIRLRRQQQQEQPQPLTSKTPFDSPDHATSKRQILSFLRDPSSPTSFISSITNSTNNWDWPLVHIVNTRFMQEQGHLEALGMARLHLFRTFCLPTMVHQSTQQFLWIIKTDPHLAPSLRQALIKELQPYPNIYLVASNVNFMIRDNFHNKSIAHSWRDGAEIQDLLQSTIYTGDPTRLFQAMLQKDQQVVLETRLDADDGLHRMYLQQIQEKALDQFGIILRGTEEDKGYIPPKWLYWCTRRHVEWHGGMQLTKSYRRNNNTISQSQLLDAVSSNEQQQQAPDYHGTLLVVEHSKLCITPGITVGFGLGTPAEDVPIHAHDKLYKAIHSLRPEEACGYTKVSDCLELVEDFLLEAVRARTPTSAGMQRVGAEDEEDDNDNDNTTTNSTHHHPHARHPKIPHPSPVKMFLYWDLMHDDFHVLREQVQYTNRYILNHLVPIAKDNLRGQCTSDHSCKEGTKEKLLKIIEENNNNNNK